MSSDTGLVSEEHEITLSAAGGNWGCLQNQINKFSALEGKAGAEPRDSFISFTPENKTSLHVRTNAPSSLA